MATIVIIGIAVVLGVIVLRAFFKASNQSPVRITGSQYGSGGYVFYDSEGNYGDVPESKMDS